MIFGLVACGSGTEKQTDIATEITTEEAQKDVTETEGEAEETKTEAETE